MLWCGVTQSSSVWWLCPPAQWTCSICRKVYNSRLPDFEKHKERETHWFCGLCCRPFGSTFYIHSVDCRNRQLFALAGTPFIDASPLECHYPSCAFSPGGTVSGVGNHRSWWKLWYCITCQQAFWAKADLLTHFETCPPSQGSSNGPRRDAHQVSTTPRLG